MTQPPVHVLEILEAIYREAKSERAWVDGILEAARPAMDRGLGIVGYPFEQKGLGVHAPWTRVLGTPRNAGPMLFKSLLATARDNPDIGSRYRAPTCATASELGLSTQPAFGLLRERGILDSSGVTGFDTMGHGIFIGAPLARVTALDAAFRARFMRVAAHLGVGQRYRRTAKRPGSAPDAIFSANAKLLHAEGDAQEPAVRAALARAVVAIDRARGRQRRTDPDGALEAWKGLVDARWSLVDAFESDGKRYIVARENEPHALPIAPLSKREQQIVGYVVLGHTTKLIAYELGIADSTVRVLLRRAMQRLGVTSRDALAAKVMAPLVPLDGVEA